MAKKKDGGDPVEQTMAKAFAHPLRVQILTTLNRKTASPNMLSQELDQSLNLVAYHVRVLEKYDCIELVDTKQRRGATEHFYRASRGGLLTAKHWKDLPSELRPGLTEALLRQVAEDIEESIAGDVIESREGKHMSRTPLVLDEQGWRESSEALEAIVTRLGKIQADAAERLKESGAESIQSKAVILHFESPAPPKPSSNETVETG